MNPYGYPPMGYPAQGYQPGFPYQSYQPGYPSQQPYGGYPQYPQTGYGGQPGYFNQHPYGDNAIYPQSGYPNLYERFTEIIGGRHHYQNGMNGIGPSPYGGPPRFFDVNHGRFGHNHC